NYCYASYFLELADYFEYENVESDKMIDLIYWTFKALILNKVPNNLIRRIYELKILKYQGIYKDGINLSTNNETLIYTWDFIIKTEPSKLYSFKLKDNIYKLFDDEMKIEMRNNVSKKMKTLEFLK
ncbi:MAG: DNA repair protein RecO C-terminal domain-containing protein, partial [Lachnospiraceae bacterium]|nr:DNA repair protein RecO C-terminal domain-containing protein [Lachnospiraceae bacterium]